MASSIYVIRKCEPPWGDYGDILIHGMSMHLSRDKGRIRLERTGPFMPSMTLPGGHDLIVNDSVRKHLAVIDGLKFKSVIKARIVLLEWHRWDADFDSDEPPVYPPSGEPEDYIIERPHDGDCAEALGDVWQVVPDIVPDIQARGGLFNRAAYRGQHLVSADELAGYLFVSSQLKRALEELDPEWIRFEQACEA